MIDPAIPFLVAAVFVLVGALVQGSIGFGVGMIAAPFLMWAIPDSMPATSIALGGAMTVTTLASHWRHVDLPTLAWTLLGRFPGLVVGSWLVVALPGSTLGVLVGLAVVLAVVLQWSRRVLRKSPRNLFVAGVVSGATGTATGIGGPPVAMVLAGEPGQMMRATLAANFLVGSLLSLGALGVVGKLGATPMYHALLLLPPLVLGALLALPVARYLDNGRTRKAILLAAASAGVLLAVTSWMGQG